MNAVMETTRCKVASNEMPRRGHPGSQEYPPAAVMPRPKMAMRVAPASYKAVEGRRAASEAPNAASRSPEGMKPRKFMREA